MTDRTSVEKSTSDKRSAILEATLNLISERGFHNTPMSMIAKESGVSTGIIYHYFANKEELIYELYREIKYEMFKESMKDLSEQLPFRDRFLALWFNFIRYHIRHPRKTTFLEQFENSPYAKPSLQEAFMDEITQINNFINQGIAEGILKDIPFGVSAELTFGVAVSLAKQHNAGAIVLDDELLQVTANACWDAISV